MHGMRSAVWSHDANYLKARNGDSTSFYVPEMQEKFNVQSVGTIGAGLSLRAAIVFGQLFIRLRGIDLQKVEV